MIGISVDKREKNRKFAESLGVEFPILSDEQKVVSQEYGVLMAILRLANRVTFVIDKQGVIREILRGGAAIDPNGAHQACSVLEKK